MIMCELIDACLALTIGIESEEVGKEIAVPDTIQETVSDSVEIL